MSWQNTLAKSLRVASQASREAGDMILKQMKSLQPEDIQEKGPNDFVTRIDKLADELIRQRLAKECPDDGIISEEQASSHAGREAVWIIDPLDGTTNYVHHIPHFCVSIGLAISGRMEVAAIYNPVNQEHFLCKRDEGVWLNDTPITVSSCPDLAKALITTGFPARYKPEGASYLNQFREIFPASASIRRTGSAALDLAYVACGRFDGFWEPFLSIWDMAAGVLLVEVAGGTISDIKGGPWNLDSRGIIAANPNIHKEMARLISSAPSSP